VKTPSSALSARHVRWIVSYRADVLQNRAIPVRAHKPWPDASCRHTRGSQVADYTRAGCVLAARCQLFRRRQISRPGAAWV